MRWTNSTLMKAAGADPKVAADNRGRGLKVAMDEYTYSTLDQKREAQKSRRARSTDSAAKTLIGM